MFSQLFQDKGDVTLMFREGSRINENVIYINYYKPVEIFPKDSIHVPLEDSRRVEDFEGRDPVFIVT